MTNEETIKELTEERKQELIEIVQNPQDLEELYSVFHELTQYKNVSKQELLEIIDELNLLEKIKEEMDKQEKYLVK